MGSFLFHTFANVWSEFADPIPIWLFVAAAALVAANRAAGVRPRPVVLGALLGAVAFMVVFVTATDPTTAAPPPSDPLNGSGQYAPALIGLAAFAAVAWRRGKPPRGLLLAATLAFLAALFFRSIDLRVCAAFPLGTHFLWHVMNGLMVGLVLVAMLAADPGPRRKAADR